METEILETINSYNKNAEMYSKAYNLGYIEKQLKFYVKNFGTRRQGHCTGKRILDIGCGPGRDAAYFSKKGFEVVGIDLSEELLKIARENSPGSKFMNMDMRALSFDYQLFDGIWACSSFLHVPYKDAESTLRGFNRVLKQKGLMFLCVLKGEGEQMMKSPNFEHYDRFFALYSSDRIKSLVRGANFNIIKSNVEAKPRGSWINLFCRKNGNTSA